MCGRTVVARSIGELVTLFDIDDVIGEQPGITYNNPPSLPASIIVDRVLKENEGDHAGELRRQLHAARWGLIPKNSQGPANTPLHNNARIETVLQKPTFRNAVLRQHCVMPISGYYEWQIKEDGSKQPFYINAGDQGMLALAGIYDWWLDPTKKPDDPTRWLLSFAILTKDAAEPLAPIHERNPILLSESSMTEWLDPDNLEDPENTTQDLLNELANESDEIAGQVEFWPVSTDAGHVRNNGESLIKRIHQD
jgi:putative SOS response-associated peptidase YedK